MAQDNLLFSNILGSDDDENSRDPRMILARSLMRSFQEGAQNQSRDPIAVAEENLSRIPLGRRLLADFLVGFQANFSGQKLKTVREQLVEREVLSQQLKAQQIQNRQRMLQAQLQLVNSLAPDQKQQALQRLFESGQITEQDMLREQAGLSEVKPPEPAKPLTPEQQFAAAQTPEEREAALAGVRALAEAKRAPEKEEKPTVGTPFQELVKAKKTELGREPNSQELLQIKRSLDKPKEKELVGAAKIPAQEPLGQAAQQAFLRIAPQMVEGRADTLQQSLEFMVQRGDRSAVRDTLQNTAISLLPADQQKAAAARPAALEALDRMENTLDRMTAIDPNITGKISGNLENLEQRLLGGTRNPELAQLAQQFKFAVLDYTRAQSGVAVRPEELERYEKLYPDITKTPALNRTLIQGLRERWQREQQFFIKNTLGDQAFDALFAPQVGDRIEVR